MANASSITVNDRQPTPGPHTYAPRAVIPGTATFVEAASVPIGERTLTIRHRKSGTRFYSRITLAVPVLVTETINGVQVPKVPRISFIDANFRFDDTSSTQERADAVGMFANLLAANQNVVNSTVVGLEGIW